MKKNRLPQAVLIISNEDTDFRLLSTILSNNGFRIFSASTESAAIELIRTQIPDLILIDTHLDDTDGFDLCRKLKLSQKLKLIPILFLTNLTDTADKFTGFEAGAVDYIAKPFTDNEVINRVKSQLELNRLRAELDLVNLNIKTKNKQLETEIAARKQDAEKLEESKKGTLNLLNDLRREIELRTKNEDALQQSEERFRLLFNNAQHCYQSLNANGQILEINNQWLETFGYQRDEVLGKQFTEFVSTDYRFGIKEHLLRFKERGQTYTMFEVLHKNGTILYVTLEGRIEYDLEKKFVKTHCVLQDVSDNKQVNYSLRRSREDFKELFDIAPVGYHEIDQSGKIIRMNETELNMLGYTPDEVIGTYIWNLSADVESSMQKVNSRLSGSDSGSETFERNLRCKDGNILTVSITDKILRNKDGKIIGIRATVQDITERVKAEKALRISEEKFRKAFMTSPDCVNINNVQTGEYVLANQGFTNVLGYEENEIIGKTSIEMNIWVDLSDRERWVRELNVNGEVKNFITKFRAKNGSIIHALVSATHIEFDGGKYVLSISRDITDRKNAEIALTASEFKFRSLFENSPVPLCYADNTGAILLMNNSFRNTFGYNSDDLPTMAEWWQLAYPDTEYRNAVIEKWAGAIDKAVDNNHEIEGEVYKIRCKNGIDKEVIISAIVISDHILGTFIDVSNQKAMEKMLVRQAERLRNLHKIDLSILLVKKSREEIVSEAIKNTGKLINCDFGMAFIFDIDKKEIKLIASLGQNIDLFNTEMKLPDEIFENLEILSSQKRIVNEDFTEAMIDSQLYRQLYDNGIRSFVIEPFVSGAKLIGGLIFGWECSITLKSDYLEIIKEVAGQIAIALEQDRLRKETELYAAGLEKLIRKRTVLLEEANKELEAFSYSVSHDLRAPLRHINGYVELLNTKFSDEMPQNAKRYLGTIADSTRHMGKLIDDLLEFSKSGRKEISQSGIKMNLLLSEVLDSLNQDTKDRIIEWKISNLPTVKADYNLLTLVFQNLLGNAIKFTRNRDKAVIEVGCHEESDEFVFFVRDNGAGFDMRYAHKLFGVFQRLHHASEYEGTGIGLANVRRIILKHGGRTWAEAELDKGATFYFTLNKSKEDLQW